MKRFVVQCSVDVVVEAENKTHAEKMATRTLWSNVPALDCTSINDAYELTEERKFEDDEWDEDDQAWDEGLGDDDWDLEEEDWSECSECDASCDCCNPDEDNDDLVPCEEAEEEEEE
jgi:hypothetical protein